MKKLRLLSLLALGAASMSSLVGCNKGNGGEEKDENAVKIGLICLHDSNSTYDANFINGLNEAVEHLGKKVIFEKNCLLTGINEDEACYDAAKDLVDKGCKVIFADSFGHQAFMLKAAQENPDVQFCHATGTNAKTSGLANYHNAFASIYQGRFLAGYAAGLKLVDSKSADQINAGLKVGYVGAFTYAEVMSGYTSWFLGLRNALSDYQYDPSKVTMDVSFTGSWYDPNGEASAADALIKDNCVLISQHHSLYARKGLYVKATFFAVTFVYYVFSDAANSVAAHLSFAAVGVEHTHLGVIFFRRADENEPVAADALMAIGNLDREFFGVFDFVLKTVDIYVIVADTVHFGKLYHMNTFCG